MSTHPIDIIANAILSADSGHPEPRALAEVAVDALTDPAIVAGAVAALKADGWEETHEGPLGIGTLSDQDLTNIALAVLRSVGGG